MNPGQGFAELVTLENVEEYRPLLRTPEQMIIRVRVERLPRQRGDRSSHFQGLRLRVPHPFTWYRRPLPRLRPSRPTTSSSRTTQPVLTFTEASYHYPQGTHLGHILAILKVFGQGRRDGTAFADRYVRLRGGLGTGRLSAYRRQVKYKLQAAVELGLISDPRLLPRDERYTPQLTERGRQLYEAFLPLLNGLDLSFPLGREGLPSSLMAQNEEVYNQAIRDFIGANGAAREIACRVFLSMPAVQQMRRFIEESPTQRLTKVGIYERFFRTAYVKAFCGAQGIPPATATMAPRRCPFLISILDACGVVGSDARTVTLES